MEGLKRVCNRAASMGPRWMLVLEWKTKLSRLEDDNMLRYGSYSRGWNGMRLVIKE